MVNLDYAAISGAMPKWRRYAHRLGCALMCLLFSGMLILNLHLMAAAPDKARRVLSVLFVTLAGIAITGMIWYLRRIISEFRYDGSTLEYRTVGTRAAQTLPVAEITSIRSWQGKSGPLGYRLACRGRRKLYLEHSVDNSTVLVNQLRTDMV